MNIKKRYELVQKTCEAFNLPLTDITAKDVESKIIILKKLYKDGENYRDQVFKIANKLLVPLLVLIISAILSMKEKTITYIDLSHILEYIFPVIIFVIVIIGMLIISCMGIGYKLGRYVISSFLVPYGHLIDYSIYWLKFIKEELPEIKDYLKKRESMQDIENYEKEVSIKKFAKVYIEWKNLSSNKENQVINLLKEESKYTMKMLNKRKHFEELSRKLDKWMKEANS
ncbi:hypothetical protein ACWNT3_07375 [Ligilactobacillus salivarius]